MPETYSPRDVGAVKAEFGKLAELLDHAMKDPSMEATPHIAAVLHMVSMGLFVLARFVFEHSEPLDGGQDGS